jgi:hypothetical protein
MLTRALALGALALAGCSDESPECAGVQGFGLVIEVTDAETTSEVCDAQVHLAHEGHDEDLASDGLDPCRYVGATTPGRYTIEVSADGYETETIDVEVATASTCSGLDTQSIAIELTPVP